MNSSGFLPTDFSPENNGLYRASTEIGNLHAAAFAAGLSWMRVDLGGVCDRGALLEIFAREFRFPHTFGGNWDALADCLQDLSWLPGMMPRHSPRQKMGAGWLLALQGVAGFASAAPELNSMLLTVLGVTADYWQQQRRAFLVLMDGRVDLPVFPPR